MTTQTNSIQLPSLTALSDVMRAAVRRVWLQGRPVYENINGKTYAWWPDGRIIPKDGSGPEFFAETQTVLTH